MAVTYSGYIQWYTTDCPTSDCPLLQILGNTHRLSVLENFWGITLFLGIFFVKIENFATFQLVFYVDLVYCVKFSYFSIVFAVIRKIFLENGSFD